MSAGAIRNGWGAATRVGRIELALVAGAFAVRLAYGLSTSLLTGGDAAQYLVLAHNLADGHGFSLAANAPYGPSDFRMPGYPALVAVAFLLKTGDSGVVFLNSLLGTAAVVAVALIARQVFPNAPGLRLLAVAAVAFYPPLVTYSSVAYAENLSVAAVTWFVYVAFFKPIDPGRRWHWLVWLFATSTAVVLARAEGVVVVVMAVILIWRLRRLSLPFAAAALACVLVAPVGWIARNEVATHRLELTDSLDRDVTLLLSFNDGNLNMPLYRQGIALAYRSTSASRSGFHRAVDRYISDALSQRPGHVAAYKLKSLANLVFLPVVWRWSASRDYSFSDAVRDPTARNLVRLMWSVVLVLEYVCAAIGISWWWRRGQPQYVAGILLYPAVAFLLAIPFHAELRLWFAAAPLIAVPAAQGLGALVTRYRVLPERALRTTVAG
jgi:hypothetical protein